MIELENRVILDNGKVICNDRAIEKLIYLGKSIEKIYVNQSKDVELYNSTNNLLDSNYPKLEIYNSNLDKETNWFEKWFTPEPFKSLDIEVWLLNKCESEIEEIRVAEELILFNERNMYPVLKHLVYMVEIFRKNNIVWGVGRGSSVSSFILYLIGINRINPILYDLDVKEFFR